MTANDLESLLIMSINQNTMAEGTKVFNIDNSKTVAKLMLKLAIRKVGRSQAAIFNKARVTFNLIADKSVYNIASELIKDFPALWNLEYMYKTVSPGLKTTFVTIDQFRDKAAGSTITGYPRLATMNSREKILEVWPIPDAAYAMIAQAKINSDKLSSIPDEYHDFVLTTGYQLIHAARNVGVANSLMKDAQSDLERDEQPSWSGSRILPTRSFGAVRRTGRSDSLNITGE